MKGIVVTPENAVAVRDFATPLYRSTSEVTGGFEIVYPRGLPQPYCMIVDDEGLRKKEPLNAIGSIFYETHKHGSPIVGTIVIMKQGYGPDGPDIVGLDSEDIDALLPRIQTLTKAFTAPVERTEQA